MADSEVEKECIVSHLHAAMLMVNGAYHGDEGASKLEYSFAPEFTCLRSMMLEPQNPTMWNSIALVYLMTGRVQDAEEAIERSLELDTGNAWTWSIWGDIFDQSGNDVEAERTYRMAIELGSTDPHNLRQLARIYYKRRNFINVLEVLEYLIPLSPSDQMLWDQYTSCLTHNLNLGTEIEKF